MKKYLFLVLVLFSSITEVHAVCERAWLTDIATSNLTLPKNIVVESRNYNGGEVIYSSGWPGSRPSSAQINGCGSNYVVGFYYMNPPQSNGTPVGDMVFPTGLTGLGVKISTMNQAGPYDYVRAIDNSFQPGDGKPKHKLDNPSYNFQLIATGGPISSGTLSFGSPVARVDFRDSPGKTLGENAVGSQLTVSTSVITVKAMGCNVTGSPVNLPMGNIKLSDFDSNTKVGSASAALTLDCEPGTNVSLSVAAPQVTSGDTANNTVIALTNAGSPDVASNVGVQLGLQSSVYNTNNNGLPLNTPIALATSKRTSDGDGTISVTGGAPASIPMTITATYYKTASPVGPGLANATGTLNFTYN
ncbi:type 1 fimbrial protein [Budviciaceae bacterium CWB-B4]|uniref:Type 1 fimbrial protein n=1 Tax=Limnobaculum xujianqingii TaxID=2738837 RepID=A0A9D7FX54_9GAMM|nr:type 1 fimbrial protein [Limnobaculum xujianqingii]MBK5072587.1 type 1 fimbrial protein [Limnobaculum xujianqingii]MBK5175896.1 type 1 fimbrial protein [Limnobaculum xujianqingii]